MVTQASTRSYSARAEWVAKQACGLCNAIYDLLVFRDVGAPPITWSKKGPSHNKLRIVCRDQYSCLVRQQKQALAASPEPEPAAPKKRATKKKAVSRKGTVTGTAEAEVVHAPVRELSKLAKELLKPDKRQQCSIHGHKNIITIRGEYRFVCCGREAPQA